MNPTANQIAKLALALKADAMTIADHRIITDAQIANAVHDVVDLFDGGVHDAWDDQAALFTALDVLDDIVQADALEAMVPERERDYIRV